MTSHRHALLGTAGLAVIVACAASPAPSDAQSLAGRIKSASTPRVQFEFVGRSGICGDGQSFLSGGDNSFYGNVNVINGVSTQPCSAGPVRVVVDRSDDVVTNIETVAGPLHTAEGATDLGTIPGRDAVDYLMAIAKGTDGRASREAILPATLADGVDVAPALVAIARDQNRPLDTRRSALSWLARDATESNADVKRATDLLLALAHDENETQSLRRSALGLLGRVGHGAGIPALVRIATDNSASWTGEESLRALAQSGDPRAREFLRTEVRRTDLPDDMLTVAIRGLGGSEATGQDIALLRASFATTPGDRARSAIMQAIAQRGTASDTQWLLQIARDTKQNLQTRRRALDLAARGTAGSAEALAMYDSMDDANLKSALIQIYAQNNDRASIDKLISIAKTDADYTLRRRAISSLSKTQDPRARQLLVELTTR
jgi:HEAT repeat protein